MFSQLVFVRIKAAEKALRDGRLDEAYRLATTPDLQKHPRAAAVLAELSGRFLERARGHFRADRFVEALADLTRATAGGDGAEEIAELRDQVQTVAAEVERQQASKRERVDAARRRIEGGSLAAGRKMLEQAGEHDRAAGRLEREAAKRTQEVGDAVDQANKLIKQGQHATAAERVRRARSLDRHNAEVCKTESHLCDKVFEAVRAALREGRLGRASDELACLGDLGDALPAKLELMDLLAIAAATATDARDGRYGEARRHAMSLARMLPKAKWLDQTIEQMQRIDDLQAALAAGPLGERIEPQPGSPAVPANKPAAAVIPASLDDTVALPPRLHPTSGLPDRLLLLVDGGGSYMLIRGDRTSIGRVACDRPADVAIFSDLAERHAEIARMDDDYFLLSGRDVEVGGVKTQHQLLRDGDRVLLGRKAKFTFKTPSRKSPSAILDLSDTTKMPNDVRRVVLFHRHALIGQGAHAHIQCRHVGTPLVLFERDGSLWLRPKNDGHVDGKTVRLPLGEPVEVHGLSLVLEPWKIRTFGGTNL